MTVMLPPQNTPPVDADGQMSQAWTQWLAGVARRGGTVPQATTDSIVAAATAAAAAQTRADAAQAQVTALAQNGVWLVGDYRQSAKASLGSLWLLCDGSSFSRTTYPALEAVLAPITALGPTGTRLLPQMPVVYDPAHPNPGDPPVLQTWIKAQ